MFSYLISHSFLFYLIQPFWRDEAFSVLYAEKPIAWIVSHSSFDPPIYYILLHYWMRLFGQSEIAVRSLSFVGFTLAVVVTIHLAEHLFKKHWLSWFIPLLFFVNPMHLLYGCEARAYGWYMFFAMVAIYGYIKRDWRWFLAGSILGFYTHSYMILVPFSCALHYFLVHHRTLFVRRAWLQDSMVKSLLWVVIGISPWLVRSIISLRKFTSAWYFPVDFHLIKSVLGNMFTGYEGTPWYLWNFTTVFSIIFLFLAIIAVIPKKTRQTALFFLFMTVFPLFLVIGISFKKPLFVNRYLIPVTAMELFVLGYAVSAFRVRLLRIICAAMILAFSVGFSVWFPAQHSKKDYRTPIAEINALLGPNDVIYADNPLHFFETMYYAKDRQRVYLFMPEGGQFPWYIGDVVLEPRHFVSQLPSYPIRAFVLHENATYTIMYTLPFARL